MLRRHLGPWLALSAAGLLIGAPAHARVDTPATVAADEATPPETVDVLSAARAGDVEVVARGAGEDRVRIHLKNRSTRRLSVVLPAGLVAAASTGQGGGGGGGFQNMGLGAPTAFPGAFGRFEGSTGPDGGFRSVAPKGGAGRGIDLSAGREVEFSMPSVCLNYGVATPGPGDAFTLVDVAEFTPDARVRKALRSLATLGTSQTVAQAVMWSVANGMTLEQLAAQEVRRFSAQELTLAARFLRALDGSGSSELVEPAHLAQARIRVRLTGEGAYGKDVQRLSSELSGGRLLGLPVEVVRGDDLIASIQGEDNLGCLAVDVRLVGGAKPGSTKVRLGLGCVTLKGWVPMGGLAAQVDGAAGNVGGSALLDSLDRAIASEYVQARVVRRSAGRTTLEVRNRLPFTLANVALRAGRDDDAAVVPVSGVGIAPGRSATVSIAAPGGLVDHVELNGL